MKFSDKYTTADIAETNKIALTTDTYALCEMLVELIAQLERNRIGVMLK